MNILIIEPNRILAKNYVTFFKKTFKNVYLACDADQAVAMADKLSIDIVLSEIFYIKHNVLEFLYEFRSYVDWQDIPFVIYSVLPKNQFKENQHFLMENMNVSKILYKEEVSLKKLETTLVSLLK